MYFWSNRPSATGEVKKDSDLWMSERNNEGWDKAQMLDTLINNEDWQIAPTLAKNGNLYFASFRYFSSKYNENIGKMDLYKSEFINGKYSEPVNLGNNINTAMNEKEVFIAPDESYIIFNSDREGGIGDYDLYISFKTNDGQWTKSINMGEQINSNDWDGVPIVTIDGKYLFYSSMRIRLKEYCDRKNLSNTADEILGNPIKSNSDIYWVSAKIIEELRSK